MATVDEIRQRQRRVVELTAAGLGLREIAQQLGVAKRTVCRDRVATGIVTPPKPPSGNRRAPTLKSLSDIRQQMAERQRQVVELTAQGLCLREIAQQLGCTVRTVSRDRGDAGIAHPTNRAWTDEEHHRALTLIADGASLHDVSETLGRSYDAICVRFQGMGWTGRQIGQYNRLRAMQRTLGV